MDTNPTATSAERARRVRLRDLHILDAVARAGSMGGAATALGLSRPAVSQAIADLEEAVGLPLLERLPRGITPTHAGTALLRGGAETLDALDRALRDAAFSGADAKGEVRVSASGDLIAAGVLADAVDRTVRLQPRLHVTIVETDDPSPDARSFRDRSLDLMINRVVVGRLDDDLEQEILYDEPLRIVAARNGRWAGRQDALRLDDLAEAPWVLPPSGTLVTGLVAEAFRVAGLRSPRATATSCSVQLRLQLLLRGDYVTPLPASALRQIERRWPVAALPLDLPRAPPVAMLTRHRQSLGPAVRLFLDQLREAASEAVSAGDAPAG